MTESRLSSSVVQEAARATLVAPASPGQPFILKLGGSWAGTLSIEAPQVLLKSLSGRSNPVLALVIDQLQDWDSALPTYLLGLLTYCSRHKIAVELSALPDGVQRLLHLATAVPERSGARRSAAKLDSPLQAIGKSVLALNANLHQLLRFIGETMLALWAQLRGRTRMRTVDLLICVQDAGPSALPIVTLISLLVGLILAFVGAVQLAMFGAQIYIANLVALGTVREMGVLMTAVIVSGRTGAAYAAQLGTMNVNSEIDALKTMGISPHEFLVLPRMWGLVLMMPLLCLYADLMGIVGGAVVSVSAFDVSLAQYYAQIQKTVHLHDFGVGIFKSLVFAVLIATAGCMRGMQCGRSASAVGDAATAAVVDSIIYIVIADSLITLVFNRLGI